MLALVEVTDGNLAGRVVGQGCNSAVSNSSAEDAVVERGVEKSHAVSMAEAQSHAGRGWKLVGMVQEKQNADDIAAGGSV